jgi:hypothetical protein
MRNSKEHAVGLFLCSLLTENFCISDYITLMVNVLTGTLVEHCSVFKLLALIARPLTGHCNGKRLHEDQDIAQL